MQQQYLERSTAVSLAPRAHQVGPRDMLMVLIRRRWIILGVALPIIVFATIGTLRTSEVMTAGTRVLIEPRAPESPAFSPIYVDYTVLMSTAAQVAMSIPVADRAATALIDSLPMLAAADPALARIRTREHLRDELLGGVDAAQVGESHMLNILFRHENARFAVMAVGAITTAYINYSLETQQNPRAVGYYTEQIARLQTEVDSLMSQRARFRHEAGYAGLQNNAAAAVGQIMALEESYFKARAARISLQTTYNGLKAAVAADPDYLPALKGAGNANLVAAKDRFDEAVAKLSLFRVQYQDDSEWVQRQTTLVNEARSVLRHERDSYLLDQRIQLEEAASSEAALKEAVDGQKAALSGYPEVERQVESIDGRLVALKDLQQSLQLKRGEAQLKGGSDIRVSNIVPVNAPAIQTQVAGSKKMLYLALAGLFGVSLGFISALFVDSQDHRLFDRRRAEQVLEVPVLAAITDTPGAKKLP